MGGAGVIGARISSAKAVLFPGSVGGRSHPGIREWLSPVNDFLLRAVPSVSARTLAFCRIIFGVAMLYLWVQHLTPDQFGQLSKSGPYFTLNTAEWLSALSGNASVRTGLYWAAALGWLSFTLGVATRLTYPVLAVVMWFAALLGNHGHVFTPLLLAITATVPARWSDAISFDRAMGLAKPAAARSQLYGYPIWLLGLCIALAYFNAGLSKLVVTNGAWLWETGARFGFATDLRLAATNLGVWLIDNYWLALMASAFAAFGQIAYLWASFTRSALIKAAIGLFIALPFLIGLVLFMGLFWWQWVLLVFLLYIPWPQLDRLLRKENPERAFSEFQGHRGWAISVAWLLVGSHLAIVAARTHAEPFLSNYDMYAAVFSPATDRERVEWDQFRPHDLNHVNEIEILTVDGGTVSYSSEFRWAYALSNIPIYPSRVYPMQAYGFDPPTIWRLATAERAIDEPQCRRLRDTAISLHGEGVLAVRYRRRSYDIVAGLLVWQEHPRALRVSLDATGCRLEWDGSVIEASAQ
jgi:hypothetical protein